MNATKHLDDIHSLIQSEDYAKAKVQISEARSAGHREALLSLFEATCVYEEGDDIETLRLVAEFLASTTKSEKRPYALFTAAVCLENLGLNEQALELLQMVPETYQDLHKERVNATNDFKRQKQALLLFTGIRSR
jgi:TolA-binding protein